MRLQEAITDHIHNWIKTQYPTHYIDITENPEGFHITIKQTVTSFISMNIYIYESYTSIHDITAELWHIPTYTYPQLMDLYQRTQNIIHHNIPAAIQLIQEIITRNIPNI